MTTCAECGVEVRLVHRYPKGQQPERSHSALATATPMTPPTPMTPTQPAATPTGRALTAEEEAELRDWVANVEPVGKPVEVARLLATLDAERAARAPEGAQEMPPDVSNLPPLDIYARGFQDGAAAARFDASLRAARAEPGLREALYREVGRRLTDERIDKLIRDAGIPLHGRPVSVDLQARQVAAMVRANIKEPVDAALEAHGEPQEGER